MEARKYQDFLQKDAHLEARGKQQIHLVTSGAILKGTSFTKQSRGVSGKAFRGQAHPGMTHGFTEHNVAVPGKT